MRSEPLLVVVTGPDGTGKSTLVAEAAARLDARLGPGAAHTAQVWDSLAGLLSRLAAEQYLGRLGDRSRALLILHAVSRSLDLATEAGARVLLADGYWYKYAVSERALGAPLSLFEACEAAFPRPDLAFCLDLPVGEALGRKDRLTRYEQGLGRIEGNEDQAFAAFQAVLAAAWRVQEDRVGPWHHLDAHRPAADLADEVAARVLARL